MKALRVKTLADVKGAPQKTKTIQEIAFAAYTNHPQAWRPGSRRSTTTTRRT